jgi:hypothetical protein
VSDRVEELLDEIVRLIVISLRNDMDSQADAISVLTSAGFAAPRIAQLLGTSAATVRVAQQRSRKKGARNG